LCAALADEAERLGRGSRQVNDYTILSSSDGRPAIHDLDLHAPSAPHVGDADDCVEWVTWMSCDHRSGIERDAAGRPSAIQRPRYVGGAAFARLEDRDARVASFLLHHRDSWRVGR
jgi:hypothetical protein